MVGGRGNSRHWGPAFSTAAQVPGGENALQRPQHDDTEQHDQNDEEREPPPIPGLIPPAEALRRLRRCSRRLAPPDVDADAHWRGAV